MLASQAALCSSTGSLEILVFHTLSAGNIGQFGAPGTAVAATGVAVTGAAVAGFAVTGVAVTGAAVTGVAVTMVAVTGVAVRGAAVTLVVDATPHPGADAATKAPTAIQRPA